MQKHISDKLIIDFLSKRLEIYRLKIKQLERKQSKSVKQKQYASVKQKQYA